MSTKQKLQIVVFFLIPTLAYWFAMEWLGLVLFALILFFCWILTVLCKWPLPAKKAIAAFAGYLGVAVFCSLVIPGMTPLGAFLLGGVYLALCAFVW